MARTKKTATRADAPSPSDNQSESSSESGNTIDFLTNPPANQSDEDENEEDEVENGDDENGTVSEESERSPQAKRTSNKTANKTPRRKQTKPKKRKDRITKEMLRLQNSTKLLIPKLPFQRLIREIMQKFQPDFRLQSATLLCLQESAECYLVTLFEDSYLCCLHRSRQTLAPKDIELVQILRGPNEVGRKNQ